MRKELKQNVINFCRELIVDTAAGKAPDAINLQRLRALAGFALDELARHEKLTIDGENPLAPDADSYNDLMRYINNPF